MSAENAKLQYESGRTATAMTALTNSGDNQNFTSGAAPWSGRSGSEPDVKPDGLATGGKVSAAVSATNNAVDVAALTCYLAGVLTSVSAGTDKLAQRGSVQANRITSVTITSGGAIAMVAGTEGATMSEVRGNAGGPPYIPVGSIEIAQVRLTSTTAAPVAASEIFQVVGLHQERFDQPIFTVDSLNGEVNFAAPLPLIHTGDLPKAVSASYSTPIFADIAKSSDYQPSENSHSVSSTQVYGGTIGSSSTTLNGGSFTAFLDDGVTDSLLSEKDQVLWFRFYPDRHKAAHILDQGKLGIVRQFPASGQIQADCTISATSAASNKAS